MAMMPMNSYHYQHQSMMMQLRFIYLFIYAKKQIKKIKKTKIVRGIEESDVCGVEAGDADVDDVAVLAAAPCVDTAPTLACPAGCEWNLQRQ